jgi:hypothetical protein
MALVRDSHRWLTLRDVWGHRDGLKDQRIAWGRLYMDVVERDGADIDQMVRETYRPPDRD